ncbi:hypothetical protein K8089_04945 [Aequorivita sp. F47161]|uniref:Sulfatase N-terminal domain-containing protein n=1 Tax=Aequorivita vitellina TaxID=2874475 RepID=A0A9X1QS54_9FLAO|nr:hypothetical protein [Aequorivita vitellina]MCG2418361.1 hypothetical protein [Aequorivita vitellina]
MTKRLSTRHPVVVGLATGLYPFLYNYYSNFTLVDSLTQLFFFIGFFLLVPVAVNICLKISSKKIPFVAKNYRLLLTISNAVGFASLLTFSILGPKKKIILLVIVLVFGLAFLLKKHLKKMVLLQYLLALIVAFQLGFYVANNLNFSTEWKQLPDTIMEANFKKKPNVYIIQPDGYANASTLKEAPYAMDNSAFEDFLTEHNFKIYPNFRSNYSNTVTSNSSMFAMTHHYYKNPKPSSKEAYGLRKSIAGNNAAVSVFNKNGYKTSLLIESPYIIVNRPVLGYDYSSISYKDLSFLSRGFDINVDVVAEMKKAITENKNESNFYFVEKILPGHIPVQKSDSDGKEKERENYIENLEKANVWLRQMVTLITKNDPQALIVIVADHGGYVGFNYTGELKQKVKDSTLVNSIFAATLAIRWPNNEVPEFDTKLKTNVNLFRILFSYLSENETYLDQLENDESFLVVREDAPFGVYKVIDANGTFTFKRVPVKN